MFIPDNYTVEAMVAVGRQAPVSSLPVAIQEKEQLTGRKPLSELCTQGPFDQELEVIAGKKMQP